tara:strand:+ start:394 stop:663 length:270 start_codon:yes stop_codon:yes gene_type:complete
MENRQDTLSCIQLIKSIIEYYGTTKRVQKKEILQELGGEIERAHDLIDNFDKDFMKELNNSGLFVEVPENIHEEIEKTFLSQLKSFQNH